MGLALLYILLKSGSAAYTLRMQKRCSFLFRNAFFFRNVLGKTLSISYSSYADFKA